MEKGPKHIVVSLQPDLLEMHEMYRKMERILKGRWYAFKKINKYGKESKQKLLENLDTILNTATTDNDDYSNPNSPP